MQRHWGTPKDYGWLSGLCVCTIGYMSQCICVYVSMHSWACLCVLVAVVIPISDAVTVWGHKWECDAYSGPDPGQHRQRWEDAES